MANLFQRKAAGGREMGGNNFDPLQSSLAQSGARVNERTLVPADGVGQPRSLLHFVEDLAQAALAARNEFLSEVNNAAAQHREVHEAARRRLEGDMAKLGDSASGLSNRLFFALKVRLAQDLGRSRTSAAASSCSPGTSCIRSLSTHTHPPAQGPTPKRPSAAETAEEVPAATAEQRLQPAPARPHAAAPGAADLEVETVNTRADLEELQSEITKLREQKQRAREADREEVRTLLAVYGASLTLRPLSSRRWSLRLRSVARRRRLHSCGQLWSAPGRKTRSCWRSWRRWRSTRACCRSGCTRRRLRAG